MRVALAASMLLTFSTSALAQDDPMEAQRCIWRCLAASRGADDPAYHACARSQCDGAEATEHTPGATRPWLPASNVPYPAVIECDTENFCLLVSCPTRGKMNLELYAVENAWMAGDSVNLRIGDSSFDLRLPQRDDRDMFSWPLHDDIGQSLKSGASVAINVDGNHFSLSLSGSASAIKSVENRCR